MPKMFDPTFANQKWTDQYIWYEISTIEYTIRVTYSKKPEKNNGSYRKKNQNY